MAARKSKSPAQKAKELTVAEAVLHLSKSQIKAYDEEAKAAGKKPLSFLANMLQKSREHIPQLEKEIGKRLGVVARKSKAPPSSKRKK